MPEEVLYYKYSKSEDCVYFLYKDQWVHECHLDWIVPFNNINQGQHNSLTTESH